MKYTNILEYKPVIKLHVKLSYVYNLYRNKVVDSFLVFIFWLYSDVAGLQNYELFRVRVYTVIGGMSAGETGNTKGAGNNAFLFIPSLPPLPSVIVGALVMSIGWCKLVLCSWFCWFY